MAFDELQKQIQIKEYFELLQKYNSENDPAPLPEFVEIQNLLSIKNNLITEKHTLLNQLTEQLTETNQQLSINSQEQLFPDLSYKQIFLSLLKETKQDLNKITLMIYEKVFRKSYNLISIVIGVSFLSILSLRFFLVISVSIFILIIYIILKINIIPQKHHSKYNLLINKREQLQSKKQCLIEQKICCEQEINSLNELINKKNEELDDLKNKAFNYRLDFIKKIEATIQEWLEEDKEKLFEEAKQELRLEYSPTNDYGEKIEENIIQFIGVNSSTVSKSFILKGDLPEEIDSRKYLKQEDFNVTTGVDGRKIYNVYEFLAIFLCSNFMSYYRCYWNFTRRASVGKEICEYFYENIVSVKYQEKSSLNSSNIERRRTYGDLLSITTTDGKTISFWINQDRSQKIGSNRSSGKNIPAKNAAEIVRYMLRHSRRNSRDGR